MHKLRSVLVSPFLAVMVALSVAALWTFGKGFVDGLTDLVAPGEAGFPLWKVPLIVLFALFAGFLAERSGINRIAPAVLGVGLAWFCASVAATLFLDIDLMFIPASLAVGSTILLVHVRKLWMIDSELTEKLVTLASTGHLLEVKSADLRIESGLTLLETVLPLSEAIVFRKTIGGELIPVARARNENSKDSAVSRQSAWRESVGLCEEALKTLKTVIRNDDGGRKSARIALPLIYENSAIGALFVDVPKDFEPGDVNLLEAFSGQLAQNFQRRELRGKSLPHQNWWGSFSTNSAENRVAITNLIHGIMKEQSFGAIASSYLQEAHAIAYLDGTLAYLNKQMRRLAGLTAIEYYDTDLFRLLERFKTDIFNEPKLAIRRVLQTGGSFSGELHYPETGKTLTIQISLVKVPRDDVSLYDTNVRMKPACFLITIRDISAVKENEKLRSDMASLMSHELRTPITSIQGFAELMLADEGLNDDSREFLTIISTESQRLSKMLSTFLSVSNLQQMDKQEVSKSPVKLDHLVHEVVNDFQETAKRKRIRLVEKANAHIPPIAADKGLISRALSNLIENAIRFSPERTSVIVSTILESDFLRVVVEDRGFGIHSSEHEKVWEKFYRVARPGQDKEEESTGLGLALVKEIVEQHGGNVAIESEVGYGSRFSIELPRL